MSSGSPHLELILGCMFAGKSDEMVRTIRRLQYCFDKILVVVHSFDGQRHEGLEPALRTKNGDSIQAIHATHLVPLLEDPRFQDAEVVAVDEGQFFPDLLEFARAFRGKQLIVAGLDGDAQRRPFGQMLDLVPLSNDRCRLNAIDPRVRDPRKPALFSMRLVPDTETVLVGGTDRYVAANRETYLGVENPISLHLFTVKRDSEGRGDLLARHVERHIELGRSVLHINAGSLRWVGGVKFGGRLTNLSGILTDPLNVSLLQVVDVVAIDDAHLFPDLVEVFLTMERTLRNKTILVAGEETVGDARSPVVNLIPLCDSWEWT